MTTILLFSQASTFILVPSTFRNHGKGAKTVQTDSLPANERAGETEPTTEIFALKVFAFDT